MARSVSAAGTALLFLVICGFTGVTAASAAGGRFTAGEAVIFALQHNGDLKALREERGLREAATTRASLYPNPVLEVEGATGKLSGSPSENSFSVMMSQELLTMGKRGKRLLVAEREAQAFDRQLENSRRLLAEQVSVTFYELLFAQDKLDLARRSLELNRQLLEVTRERLASGDIPELEANLARVELARGEGRQAEAERELYPARAKLLSLMGLFPDASPEFAGGSEEALPEGSLERFKEEALARRPDLKAVAAERGKAEAELSLARAEQVPNVTLGIGYQRDNSSTDVAGLEGFDRANLIGVRLSVPIPLFDRNQAGIGEARARKGSAESRYLFGRQAVQREVEAAYASLQSADRALSIYREGIIRQLEENLQLVHEAYRLGEVGILAVIEEHKKFFEVHLGYLSDLYNRRVALARLKSAVGGDVTVQATGGEK
ncbi:MAG TPA: TolC family protein [Geomonas sp.]|nr:TolC family protein [Geomonas sp.]